MTTSEVKKGARISGERRAEMTAKIRRLYEEGFAIRDIADELGRSYGFIHRVLTEAEVELRGRGGAHGTRLTHEQRRNYLDRLRESAAGRRRR